MENDTAKSGTTPDVAEAFQVLLGNEELLKNIRSLFAQPTQAEKTADAPTTDTAESPPHIAENREESPAQQGEVLPPVSDLRELLNNPAVAQKLPQLLAMLGPMMQRGKEEPAEQEVTTGAKKFNPKSRENLLRALKPFLSPGRQNAVESIMRISQLGQILQQLK